MLDEECVNVSSELFTLEARTELVRVCFIIRKTIQNKLIAYLSVNTNQSHMNLKLTRKNVRS